MGFGSVAHGAALHCCTEGFGGPPPDLSRTALPYNARHAARP